MKLKSMKMSAKAAKEMMPTAISDKPDYPYGLRIDLNDESLEKLGVDKMPTTGTMMILTARVEIKSTNESDHDGQKRKSMTLQITDAALEKEPEKKSNESQLYGE